MGTIGRGAVLTIDAVEVQKIMSCDMNSTNDLADDETNDNNGYKASCIASQGISLDVTCKYEEATGIEDVMQAFFSRTTDTYVFTPIASGDSLSFSGHISSLNISTSTGETIEVSFTVESTGTITFTEV